MMCLEVLGVGCLTMYVPICLPVCRQQHVQVALCGNLEYVLKVFRHFFFLLHCNCIDSMMMLVFLVDMIHAL